MKDKINLLDCTLRDGGYYTNWHFSEKTVKNYINSISKTPIKYVEIGFRFLKREKTYGPFAFSKDDFVKKLNISKKIKLCLMINAKEFLNKKNNLKNVVLNNFLKKNKSPFTMIRIAVNFDEATKALLIVSELKKLGYKIALNLMQSHNKSENEYKKLFLKLKKSKKIDVLYIADSLGSMFPEDIKKIGVLLKKHWGKQFGIHAHNNKNLALINSLTAINNSFSWCDSTVCGMGRGAGNLTTESILMEMDSINKVKIDISDIRNTLKDFEKLKQKFNWGPNFYYHFASNHNIHPTYVQMLLGDKRYDNNEVFEILKFLSQKKNNLFSDSSLKNAVYERKNFVGKWTPKNWLYKKEILLLGSGPSIKKYKDKIYNYINKNKPSVLVLNINLDIDSKKVKAYVISHEKRMLLETSKLKKLKKKTIIMPKARFYKYIKKHIKNNQIYDYALNIKKDGFEVNDYSCEMDSSLALSYALALCIKSSPKKITLAGFDGYSSNVFEHKQVNKIFEKFYNYKSGIKINLLTPSKYNIK